MKLKIPAKDEYKRAFQQIEAAVTTNEIKMLKANYNAPERTITAEIMSEKMGYKSFGGANLQYGRLANKLCEHFNLRPEYKIEILCEFIKPMAQGDNIHWLWIMRPEVAQALEELGWV